MADLPPYSDSNNNAGENTHKRPDDTSTRGTPRWVKVFGIIALILVLLVGIIMVTGIGGEHGPGRHMPGGDIRPSSVIAASTSFSIDPGAH